MPNLTFMHGRLQFLVNPTLQNARFIIIQVRMISWTLQIHRNSVFSWRISFHQNWKYWKYFNLWKLSRLEKLKMHSIFCWKLGDFLGTKIFYVYVVGPASKIMLTKWVVSCGSNHILKRTTKYEFSWLISYYPFQRLFLSDSWVVKMDFLSKRLKHWPLWQIFLTPLWIRHCI